MPQTVFFDLFYTLITPRYREPAEYEALHLEAAEWERYAEAAALYRERALGRVKTGAEIIEKIVETLPFHVSEEQKKLVLRRREERMRTALLEVDGAILETLRRLSERGVKLCLISNADLIDCRCWSESPLTQYVQPAVFSCRVGLLKPDPGIYRYAMELTGARPEESVFVGDGGSEELRGAKRVGMGTVLTEYLLRRPERERVLRDADARITRFEQLLELI